MNPNARDVRQPNYLDYAPPTYQQWESGELPLVNYGSFTPTSGTARFRVPTPDARCLIGVSLIAKRPPSSSTIPLDGTNGILFGVGTRPTLWCAITEKPLATSQESPVRDLVGTAAAPLSIPVNTRLWGFQFEVQTVGQQIFGLVTIAAAGASEGQLVLRVRARSLDRLTDQEWRQLIARLSPVVTAPANIAGP